MKMTIRVIEPKVFIETPIHGQEIIERIECFGRISHKSENKIEDGTAEVFVRNLLKMGHESVLEHVSISVRFICDRGVTHELVRHRLAAYTQESTRYCNYSGTIQFIKPLFYRKGTKNYQIWYQSCLVSANTYRTLIKQGSKPEEARSVLPNSLKTEIVSTFNLRQWRHVFKMRCNINAHPQIREIMIPTLKRFQKRILIIFDDLIIRKNQNLSFPFYTA